MINFLDIFKAAIFGIIEGITEWLPISSTGHLILADEFIQMSTSAKFKEMFDVVIQFGAILAVVVIYFNKLNPFSGKKSKEEVKDTYVLWGKVIIACIPAAVIGLLFDDFLDEHFYNFLTVAVMLIVYGIIFIVVEAYNEKRTPKITELNALPLKTAFFIGLFQVLALIPGTSRSGATIIGGIVLGASRYVAAEFTFFLAIPVMLGASLLKMYKFGFSYSVNEIAVLLTGMAVSFVVSIIAIRTFMDYIKRRDFGVFGLYRIVLGMILLIYYILPSIM